VTAVSEVKRPFPKLLQIYNGYDTPVAFIQAGMFYTYFYNHARRIRLEKLLYLEL
jgi:hypothetical protein